MLLGSPSIELKLSAAEISFGLTTSYCVLAAENFSYRQKTRARLFVFGTADPSDGR